MNDEFPSGSARPKYDPNSYYVSAVDSRGNAEKFQVKVPPDVHNRVCESAYDRSNPFRSPQDWIRNAIIHQLNREVTPDSDPAYVKHVTEITARAVYETELHVSENRRQLISAARKLADIARDSDPVEKARLISVLRMQTVGVSEEVRDEVGAMIQKIAR